MKNFLHILLVAVMGALLMLGNVESASAQAKKKKKSNKKSDDIHYVSMWGGLGYSGLVNNFGASDFTDPYGLQTQIDPKYMGGAGGMLGFGYELHHKLKKNSPNDFIFAIGPEFRFLSSQDKFGFNLAEDRQFPNVFNATRSDYSSMVQHYDFSNLAEWQKVGQVMVPIMFGGSFEKYYFLAGAKVGWGVFAGWNHTGRLTTSVTEKMAVEDWYDVPSHSLVTDAKLAQHPLYAGELKGKNKFGMFGGLDAAVSAEFGINLDQFLSDEWQGVNEAKDHPWRMRLAAFIDYGVTNMYNAPAAAHNLVDVTGDNISTHSLFQSAASLSNANPRVNSLLVGVKFTALLQLNKPKMPNPYMHIRVLDALTNEPLLASKVDVTAPGKRKPSEVVMAGEVKPTKKPKLTDKAPGELKRRYAPGTYVLEAKEGYYKAGKDQPYTWYMIDTTVTHNKEIVDHKPDMLEAGQSVDLTLLPVPHVQRTLIDMETGLKIMGNLKFVDRQDSTNVFTLPLTANQTYSRAESLTDPTRCLRYGHTYDVFVSADGYHDTTAVVSDLYSFNADSIQLRPIRKVRHKLILKHMYFATDKTDILPMSDGDLQILYNFLVENPKIRVLITGHTDDQGTERYNQKLSEGRSANVKAVMVERGIDAERMETNGMGESQPIDTNATEEGRQNNRRVEVTVLNEDEAGVDLF